MLAEAWIISLYIKITIRSVFDQKVQLYKCWQQYLETFFHLKAANLQENKFCSSYPISFLSFL